MVRSRSNLELEFGEKDGSSSPGGTPYIGTRVVSNTKRTDGCARNARAQVELLPHLNQT
jgi:hypothetical protein